LQVDRLSFITHQPTDLDQPIDLD